MPGRECFQSCSTVSTGSFAGGPQHDSAISRARVRLTLYTQRDHAKAPHSRFEYISSVDHCSDAHVPLQSAPQQKLHAGPVRWGGAPQVKACSQGSQRGLTGFQAFCRSGPGKPSRCRAAWIPQCAPTHTNRTPPWLSTRSILRGPNRRGGVG